MKLKLYTKNNDPAALQQIVDTLNDGGIIIYPTDSRYAIGCHALKERAIEQVCRLKDIDPKKNHLSVICYDLSTVSEYAKVDNNTFKLMKRHLPGPFTFILEASNRLPKIFKGRKEVGIRMPDNAIISEIAQLLGAPILTTSLPYDEEEDIAYLTDPDLIAEKWESLVDLIIDGGIGSYDETTVVDCTESQPEIVRQGIGCLEL